MITSWIISKQARHLASIVNHLYYMLISFDFHSFHFSDSSRSTEGYFRDPECVPRVLWRIFTVAFSFFTLFLFTPPPPLPAHLLLFHLPLIHHFSLPLLSLSALSSASSVSPATLRSGWGVNCLGSTKEPILGGVVVCMRSFLSFCLTTLSHRRWPRFHL